MVASVVVQLLFSNASDTSPSPSAQAWRVYVPASVSEYTLSATVAPSLSPGPSGAIACTPFGFFTLVEPTTR